METLARLVINVVDLAETEGRSLRRSIIHMMVTVGLSFTTALLTLFGLAFVCWALFRFLVRAVGPELAALIVGVVAIGLAFATARMVKARSV